MIVHLGNGVTVPSEQIVAVLNYDCLQRSVVGGSSIAVDFAPKSAVITADKTYLSVISAATLTDRAGFII